MKRGLLIITILMSLLLQSKAQSVFTSVPVVNDKVVFKQFIHIDQGLTPDQRYSLLYKWGKDNYSGNPLLSGIKFDDKAKTVTVSSKVELLLPPNTEGVREKVIMNYRFDAAVTNTGLSINVRDITYQNNMSKSSKIFPKTFSAEETIAPVAITASPESEKEFRVNTQKSTLFFLNELYDDLNNVFKLNK